MQHWTYHLTVLRRYSEYYFWERIIKVFDKSEIDTLQLLTADDISDSIEGPNSEHT